MALQGTLAGGAEGCSNDRCKSKTTQMNEAWAELKTRRRHSITTQGHTGTQRQLTTDLRRPLAATQHALAPFLCMSPVAVAASHAQKQQQQHRLQPDRVRQHHHERRITALKKGRHASHFTRRPSDSLLQLRGKQNNTNENDEHIWRIIHSTAKAQSLKKNK